MKTYEELVEQYGEAELASVSMDFWLMPTLTVPDKSFVWDSLLAYQNGYFACKEKYKIND